MVESSAWVSSLDIAIGRDGSTLLGGTFLGKLTFANTPDLTHASPEPVVSGNSFTVESGGSDGFVAKLDHEGRTVWSRSVGGVKDDEVVASGFDLAGRPHIAGNFTGQAKFGGVELTSRLSGAFGAVLDANGDGVAAQRPKGWGLSRARAGGVDGNGNLYVLGMSVPRDSHCGFDDPHMPCLGDL